jgi:hypothetical protein
MLKAFKLSLLELLLLSNRYVLTTTTNALPINCMKTGDSSSEVVHVVR